MTNLKWRLAQLEHRAHASRADADRKAEQLQKGMDAGDLPVH